MSALPRLPSREELGALTAGGLEQALVEWERVRRLAESVILDVIDLADQRQVYADDGHRSVRHWVQTLTGISRTEATCRVQSMRALRDLERVRARLRAGEVGVDQVRAIARVHANRRCSDQLPDSEELLLDHAVTLPFEDFTVVLRRWESLADADGAHRDHQRAHDERDAFVAVVGSECHLGAQCGTTQGAAMQEIFDRFVEAEFHADWDSAKAQFGVAVTKELLGRSDRQRRFDALYAIFQAAASTAPGAQAPVPLVNIVIDEVTFDTSLRRMMGGPAIALDPRDVRERRCETTSGVAIDPIDAVIAATIGHVRRVLLDGAGVVIDLGRKKRLFTGAARDAIELVHRRCDWGACDVARTQIDHAHPWSDGGTTSSHNGRPACGHHNRFKTRGYTTYCDPAGRWITLRPDGTPITEARAA